MSPAHYVLKAALYLLQLEVYRLLRVERNRNNGSVRQPEKWKLKLNMCNGIMSRVDERSRQANTSSHLLISSLHICNFSFYFPK